MGVAGTFGAEHLRLAWQFQESGELVLGGALADPADGAVLLFQARFTGARGAFLQLPIPT